jgi:NAD(P)H dehydrogenase (quinone)
MNCYLLRINPKHIIDGRWHDEETLNILNRSQGIILGSPTYMGSLASQFKAFMDKTSELWATRQWKDKVAAGFTNSGSPAGDNLNCLIQLAVFAAQHGMIRVGQSELPEKYASGGSPNDANRLGSFLGLATQVTAGQALEQAPSGDLKTAKLFGRRIAELTATFYSTSTSHSSNFIPISTL